MTTTATSQDPARLVPAPRESTALRGGDRPRSSRPRLPWSRAPPRHRHLAVVQSIHRVQRARRIVQTETPPSTSAPRLVDRSASALIWGARHGGSRHRGAVRAGSRIAGATAGFLDNQVGIVGPAPAPTSAPRAGSRCRYLRYLDMRSCCAGLDVDGHDAFAGAEYDGGLGSFWSLHRFGSADIASDITTAPGRECREPELDGSSSYSGKVHRGAAGRRRAPRIPRHQVARCFRGISSDHGTERRRTNLGGVIT